MNETDFCSKGSSPLWLEAPRPHNPLISLVIPVFNERLAILPFLHRLKALREDLQLSFELLFVNDGSTDETLSLLMAQSSVDASIRIVDLSRNFGKEAALTAGLDVALGDVVIPIDVDLQDPPELIPELLAAWRLGFDVVLAVRSERKGDPWSRRFFAEFFYKIHNRIASPRLPEKAGDFRLMDRSVVEAIRRLPETHRFMKGLFAWAGFRTTAVSYERPQRDQGESKFNGWRLWTFALEGVTSFSTVPLKIWTYIGLLVSLAAMIKGASIAFRVLIEGRDVPGYASLFVGITFLGGLQLMGIGILGEYLGRNYIEAKRRPVYLIRRIYQAQPPKVHRP